MFFTSCRRGSSRAYKVAGITLLACVLMAGQAMITYFLLSQSADIRSLESQSDSLRFQLNRDRMNGGGISTRTMGGATVLEDGLDGV